MKRHKFYTLGRSRYFWAPNGGVWMSIGKGDHGDLMTLVDPSW